MSDRLKREFGAQLTACMDTVFKRAMLGIMKIFENSVYDHQMELAHKGEEIAQLKIQLQTAQLKLRDIDRGAEVKKSQMNESQSEPKDVPKTSGQTPAEVDVEVPDDWCAPLGCETMTKEEDVCPSVRLRQLYIPLWPLPIKQEANNHIILSSDHRKGRRRSMRNRNHTQDISTQRHGKRQSPPMRNDMKILPQDTNKGHPDSTCPRRRRGNCTGKDQERSRKKKREFPGTESESIKQETGEKGEQQICQICKKGFDSGFGLGVHVRLVHTTCRGCRKVFPLPGLKSHRKTCPKLKKLLAKIAMAKKATAKKATASGPPNPHSRVEGKTAATGKTRVIVQKESASPSKSQRESSDQMTDHNYPIKKHACFYCSKKFRVHAKMVYHMRVHTGKNVFACNMCPATFPMHQSLKYHLKKTHKANIPKTLVKDLGHIGKTNGEQGAEGHTCSVCGQVLKTKRLLKAHSRIHTVEKPYSCDQCFAKFRFVSQYGYHKKKCVGFTIQCERCEHYFLSKLTYVAHVSRYHPDWEHFCKVCGKGFSGEKCLETHPEVQE